MDWEEPSTNQASPPSGEPVNIMDWEEPSTNQASAPSLLSWEEDHPTANVPVNIMDWEELSDDENRPSTQLISNTDLALMYLSGRAASSKEQLCKRLHAGKSPYYAAMEHALNEYVQSVFKRLKEKHNGDEELALKELLDMRRRGRFGMKAELPSGQSLYDKVINDPRVKRHPSVTINSSSWTNVVNYVIPFKCTGSEDEIGAILADSTRCSLGSALKTLQNGQGLVEEFGKNIRLALKVLLAFYTGSNDVIAGEFY